jgi:hypothetical protein
MSSIPKTEKISKTEKYSASTFCNVLVSQVPLKILHFIVGPPIYIWISLVYTVNIFLARNGRTRAVKFRLKNFGRISFDLGEIFPIQQILRLSNGRNSPKLGEIRPKFLRANLNCADSPILNKFRPKKNYCVRNILIFDTFFYPERTKFLEIMWPHPLQS